ncbi:uncharacterized protein B0J16DRAFT_348947 [Fusarium flagelliforme]|uniref:uncharacterized protein n=1 Tax=Fusarium flagelliforme TaxID=2675880 RepID=UPI001E8CEC51|nr:uncharacterized protein B0J16DRAFT_348947 [Fusarium flagelliforme]KAH7174677.1 hypothetical protein B0J16DRAFT_348947 [Fusarium flagelliforme]
MSGLISHARNVLAAIGILNDNPPTPLTSLFSNLPNYHRILISGLHGTGKSTLLEKHLVSNHKYISRFTIFTCLHIDTYRCSNVTFHTMDVGRGRPSGHHKMERRFFNQANAVIWVFDADDHDYFIESREEFLLKIEHEDGVREGVPLLLLANSRNHTDTENMDSVRKRFFEKTPTALSDRSYVSFKACDRSLLTTGRHLLVQISLQEKVYKKL